MAVYKANANGITHKDLILGGQKHKAVYAGDKLIWKKGAEEYGELSFEYYKGIAFLVLGKGEVHWSNGVVDTFDVQNYTYLDKYRINFNSNDMKGYEKRGDGTVTIKGDLKHIWFSVYEGYQYENLKRLTTKLPSTIKADGMGKLLTITSFWVQYATPNLFDNFKDNGYDNYLFDGLFSECSLLKTAPKIWRDFPKSSGYRCYRGCTSLSWYNEIPSDWK